MESITLRNIKAIRAFTGLTLEEFGEVTGTSGSSISLYENAKREVPPAFVERVWNAFHINPNTIYKTDMGAEFCRNWPCADENGGSVPSDSDTPPNAA
jgi:transcriptional regulator with XRE-family HTH domain